MRPSRLCEDNRPHNKRMSLNLETTMSLKTLFKSCAVWGAALMLSALQAQTFPAKSLSLVVPYPAGGPSDFVARKVQPDAAAKLGQTMIIENLGGAGGSIGLTKLINSPADGYTLSLATPMELVLAPLAIQGVKFKPEDFKMVAQLVNTNMVLAVRPSLNVKSVDELVALMKKNASQPMSYGSVGPGSLYHLIGEKFSQITKAPLLHIPYKGTAPLMADLMGGQIDMAFIVLAGSIPMTIAEGKLKGLGITSKTPHPLFKQFPPMAAMPGLEGMEFDLWAGVQVNANTPDDTVATLSKAFYAAMDNPDTRKAFESSGNAILPARSPAELSRIYAGEIERYRSIARSINLQPQ
jgi:tripartite-type tricarboxylate transporter receptor subunit TctC